MTWISESNYMYINTIISTTSHLSLAAHRWMRGATPLMCTTGCTWKAKLGWLFQGPSQWPGTGCVWQFDCGQPSYYSVCSQRSHLVSHRLRSAPNKHKHEGQRPVKFLLHRVIGVVSLCPLTTVKANADPLTVAGEPFVTSNWLR